MSAASQDILAFDGFAIRIDLENWPAKILRALLRRHYEKHELRLVSRVLAPGDRVIELGCAIGVVALAAERASSRGRIVCFDANPDMVAQAAQNFELNAKSIAVTNAVMAPGSSGPPVVTFYKTPYFLSSSLSAEAPGATPVQVQTLALETAIREADANTLIVDIEGGEFELLGTADLAAIEKLILELHVSMAGVAACMRLVADLERQGLMLDADFTAHNVFVFRREAASELRDRNRSAFVSSYLSGLADAESGDRVAAARAITGAIEANPENAHARLLLSQILVNGIRSAQAAETVGDALGQAQTSARLDGSNEDTFEQLGVLYSAVSSPDRAIDAYARAIELRPHRPLFHAGLGAVRARQGRIDEALDAFRAAVALNPASANTPMQLGRLASRRDTSAGDPVVERPEPAIAGIRSRAFFEALAPVLKSRFRFPDAAGALGWALDLAPEDEVLHCGLSVLVATPRDLRRALTVTGASQTLSSPVVTAARRD